MKSRKNNLKSYGEIPFDYSNDVSFAVKEQYKMLRTNLSFTLPENEKCNIIGVTSAVRGEGKSTTSLNLSCSIAQTGKSVLLMECDLRIPSIAKALHIQSTPGITNILCDLDIEKVPLFRSKVYDNWFVIPSGTIPPNPSELLGCSRMEKVLNLLSNDFDYIIIDLPPVNIVSDALEISKYLTGMVVVSRENYSYRTEVSECIRLLRQSNVNLLGVVFNGVSEEKNFYSRKGKYYSK